MFLPEDFTDEDIKNEVDFRRNILDISDEEEFGCKVTDEEREAWFSLKKRLERRMTRMIDEEIRRTVYKIKTGKDY